MHAEGWRRLWKLTKWLASIAVGVRCFIALMPTTAPSADSAPTAGQILIGVLFISGIAGGATFGLLHALEWAYRGIRLLPNGDHKAEAPPLEVHAPEPAQAPAQEQRPALPNPDNQQS
jgi:hypothetical protein